MPIRILLAATLFLGAVPAGAQEMQFDRSALVQSLLPMVVNINALVSAPPTAPEMAGAAGSADPAASQATPLLGSGFVIDPSGEIVTNYHVINGAYSITVTFSDGAQAAAHVEAADRLADVALLRVTPPHKLKAITWGNSGALRVGDPVLAIGNPLGVGLSVTGGIVSAVNRNIMETPYDDYIQTDAPINHGNSGGPLFDMKGDVVGINTALISPTAASAGLGFAIPASDARFIIGQLHKYGWLHPGWLGIKVQQITPEMGLALGMQGARGSIVAGVWPGPAQKAGVRVGDIVIDFDNLHPADERALLRDIGEQPPGSAATIDVLRDGRLLTLATTVGEWPRQEWNKFDAPIEEVKVNQTVPPDLGIRLGALNAAQRTRLGIPPDAPGVLVMSVQPGSDAARRGLGAGDAILEVGDHPIASTESFLAALQAARAEQRPFALILFVPQKEVYPGPEWRAFQIAP